MIVLGLGDRSKRRAHTYISIGNISEGSSSNTARVHRDRQFAMQGDNTLVLIHSTS